MQKRTRRKTSLQAWLNAVTTPVFLLSRKRKVVFFNSGCEELTGWPADEVLGRVCDYRSDADQTAVESLTGSLCPPPEVLAGQQASVPAYLGHRDGQTLGRMLNFFPLSNAEGHVESILGVVTPIGQPARVVEATPAQQLHAELASLRTSLRQRFGIKTLVCKSAAMIRVLQQIDLARRSTVSVFLRGEAGTGREHIARLIHYETDARSRAFIPIDCRRLPPRELKRTLRRLLESGSQTAPSLQPGTLYLLNVESLPRDSQELLAVAFLAARTPPVRLLASSTAELRDCVEHDGFRSDLFYLLRTIEIELPPLRRRPEDLPPLAQYFLELLNRGDEHQVGGFADEVWQQFAEYNWPGNIDELAAVVSEARTACAEGFIGVKHLPFRFRTGLDAQSVGPVIEPRPLPLEPLLKQVETEQIQLALSQCRHNKSKTAELLGITRARLYRRMQSLGIEDIQQKT